VKLSAIVEALASDLVALGALGDEKTADSARRLAAAMEGPITARLLESLSQVAAEVRATLPSGRLEVRLVGGDAELVFVEEEHANPEPADDLDADTSARITLRLPVALKARVEAASAVEGVSVNTYIVRALGQQSRRERGSKGSQRLTGFGRS
jgi:hypothetical protein